MYKRYSVRLLKQLLKEFRILYLTGPRQVGKTTLAREIAKTLTMDYVSLDDNAAFNSAKEDPHGFIGSFADNESQSEKNLV